jgi:hypothetical protein
MGNKVDNKVQNSLPNAATLTTSTFVSLTGHLRRSLGTDSLKAGSGDDESPKPTDIPLVQNGSLSVAQFKMHIDGFREATQRDFDTYLLDWLRMGEEAQRMPDLGRFQRK